MNENKYVEMLEDGILYDYISDLQKQLEAYENMRKEVIELINVKYKEQKQYDKRLKDLLNILNKVGGSDE